MLFAKRLVAQARGGGLGGLICAGLLAMLPAGLSPLAAQEPTGLQAAAAIESAMVDAIAVAERSVVAIARVKKSDREDSPLELRADPFGRLQGSASPPEPGQPGFIPNEYGTGVVIDRRGLIVTHSHVLGEDSEYWVTTVDRKVYPAKVRGSDPRSDLAVLSIGATDLTPIKFGDVSKLRKGQIVVALGNPYSIARDGQASASWGIVANLSRKAGPSPPDESTGTGRTTLHHYGTLIQTDAKLNFGTSGGALVNLKGEMIGLTTSLAAAMGYEQSAGYAIPCDETFLRVIDLLKQGREVEYGFLGVQPNNLDPTQVLMGKHGMRVGTVVEGTPAHRAGLLPGDVVTHVNGQPIYDADGLVLHVGRLAADASVRLSVERDGQLHPFTIELSKNWIPGPKIITEPSPSWRGMRVDYSTAVDSFPTRVIRGDIDIDGCVLVREVEKDSPAAREGVQPGMFISHVGSTRVSTPKEFFAAVSGKNGPVQLRQFSSPEQNRVIRTVVRTISPSES